MSELLLDSALGHMESGEYTKALTAITIYLSKYPANPDAICILGICYYKTGNVLKAKKELLKAIEMGLRAGRGMEDDR